ncbi:MAG: serine hydrolase domain-containing protein [Rhizobiaceae bacterium]
MSKNALGFDQDRLLRIDDWMRRNVEIGRYTGSSVLIARHGEVAHFSATGLSSVVRNLAYERDTILRVYSMTKMITTVGFMMLLERGCVNLHDPVSHYLPEFSNCSALIEGATRVDQIESVPAPTLHQLLTHTSGMTYAFNPGLLAEHYEQVGINFDCGSGGLDKVCKSVAEQPLAFRPGRNWHYSIGIDVIGRVIEVLDGRTLDSYLREEVFDPLGMVDTGFDVPEQKVPRFADCFVKTEVNPLYCFDSGTHSEFLEGKVTTFSGGGGLLSTLDDYFRFGEMVRRGGEFNGQRLLSPRTLAFMRRNHLPGDIASMGPDSFAEMPMKGVGFGLGGAVMVEPARSGMVGSVGDFGWGGMASTYFWTDPVEDLNCTFFTQLVPSSSYPNRAELKALVHAALVD